MLSVKIQVIVACLVLIALCVIVNMIRKKRLELRYALAWLLVGHWYWIVFLRLLA